MRRRILVVDDMELNRDHLRKVLEEATRWRRRATAARRSSGSGPRRFTW